MATPSSSWIAIWPSPQSVVLKPDGALYYRGNYNEARVAYRCPLPATRARMAQSAE